MFLKLYFLKSKTSGLLVTKFYGESKQIIKNFKKKTNAEQTSKTNSLFGRAVYFTCYFCGQCIIFTSLEKTISILKTDAFELGALTWKVS